MAEGFWERIEQEDKLAWCRTSAVVVQLYNAFRDPKTSEPIDPMKFYPWQEVAGKKAAPPTETELNMLEQLFAPK